MEIWNAGLYTSLGILNVFLSEVMIGSKGEDLLCDRFFSFSADRRASTLKLAHLTTIPLSLSSLRFTEGRSMYWVFDARLISLRLHLYRQIIFDTPMTQGKFWLMIS